MSSDALLDKARQDKAVFHKEWEGGYYEGDPIDPMATSTYGVLGYMSVLHVTYLRCIKPYVRSDTRVIEIGPGRGAWSRTMLNAKELWVADVMSAEHNGFWPYVGKHDHVKYVQVSDFTLKDFPDNHFDFFFSFGVFCHIPVAGHEEYFANLRAKLKPGAQCFLMVADYDKYNAAWQNYESLGCHRPVLEMAKRSRPKWRRWMPSFWWEGEKHRQARTPKKDPKNDGDPTHGVWYHAGTKRTCDTLTKLGYTILDPDTGVLTRDPVIHFQR